MWANKKLIKNKKKYDLEECAVVVPENHLRRIGRLEKKKMKVAKMTNEYRVMTQHLCGPYDIRGGRKDERTNIETGHLSSA